LGRQEAAANNNAEQMVAQPSARIHHSFDEHEHFARRPSLLLYTFCLVNVTSRLPRPLLRDPASRLFSSYCLYCGFAPHCHKATISSTPPSLRQFAVVIILIRPYNLHLKYLTYYHKPSTHPQISRHYKHYKIRQIATLRVPQRSSVIVDSLPSDPALPFRQHTPLVHDNSSLTNAFPSLPL